MDELSQHLDDLEHPDTGRDQAAGAGSSTMLYNTIAMQVRGHVKTQPCT